MKFYNAIAIIAITGAITVTIPSLSQPPAIQIAQVLSSEQINSRAKQIAVRIDGASTGSGVIIEENNDVYTVLTNWHVMQTAGDYTVQTIDGRDHPIDRASVRQIGGLDLATFQFTSNQNYQVAELGTSNELVEGQDIYYAGYPGELKQEDNRYYRFIPTNIVGLLPTNANKGYSLIYDGEAFPGMSGGPVLNNRGMLIGIHGEANIHAVTGATSIYAIPIDTYQQAIAKTPSQPSPVETTPPPITTKPPKTQPPDITIEDSGTETTAQPPEITIEETVTEPTTQPPKKTTANTPTVPILEDPNPPETPKQPDIPEVNNPPQTPKQPDTPEVNTNPPQTPQKPELPEINPNPPQRSPELILVSKKTGLDYTALKNLLAQGKWEESDRETYNLVTQIIKTAKDRNTNIFIELKSIAEFSCTDIGTIDRLWRKYSNNKFGFTPQQQLWNSANQNDDFSTEVWRRFATEVGWKQGDIASSSGYLLYEELKFNPQQAPTGHLPWWLPMSEEEQNVIKLLFSRCDFNAIEPKKSDEEIDLRNLQRNKIPVTPEN
jgi:S1-C subfamily serine protease